MKGILHLNKIKRLGSRTRIWVHVVSYKDEPELIVENGIHHGEDRLDYAPSTVYYVISVLCETILLFKESYYERKKHLKN